MHSEISSCAERNYAQIEKEGLSLIFGVMMFHKHLYGRHFIIVTNHKSLLAILGAKKNLSTLAAAYLQRWAIFFLGYQHNLKFTPGGQPCNADGLSHLLWNLYSHEEKDVEFVPPAATYSRLTLYLSLTRNSRRPLRYTHSQQSLRYSQESWPSELPDTLKPYLKRRIELSIG